MGGGRSSPDIASGKGENASMNRKQLWTVLMAVVLTAAAQAQNDQVPRDQRFGRAVPAAGFINRDVVTQSGKGVGQIEEVIFDMESGRVLYVALNPKGSGQTDTVAVPPTLFALPKGQPTGQTRRPLIVKTSEQ